MQVFIDYIVSLAYSCCVDLNASRNNVPNFLTLVKIDFYPHVRHTVSFLGHAELASTRRINRARF